MGGFNRSRTEDIEWLMVEKEPFERNAGGSARNSTTVARAHRQVDVRCAYRNSNLHLLVSARKEGLVGENEHLCLGHEKGGGRVMMPVVSPC